MSNNAKRYNQYNNQNNLNEDDLSDFGEFPTDSYVKPGSKPNVGKLDEYNKDKDIFNKQKSKVVFKESKELKQTGAIDDLIPADIGNAIDNVFSTVDSLLNKTGKLIFGSGKPKKVAQKPLPKPRPQPVQNVKPSTPVTPPKSQAQTQEKRVIKQESPKVEQTQKKVVQKSSIVTTQKGYNPPKPKVDKVKSNQKTTPKKEKYYYEYEYEDEEDNSPPVTRTTTISDLEELPLSILNDPDIVKYFDQMKLYDKKVPGGFCSLTFNQATQRLKNGRWGKMFMVSYENLKINTMMASPEAGLQRFNGMKPVYKALAKNFGNTENLKKAIEEDINLYLKNGEGSDKFHKFTYTVKRNK